MTSPPQSLQRILIALCSRGCPGFTKSDAALLDRALERCELIGDLWRAAHTRPEIAQAMRAADYSTLRDLAAILDAEAALAAIETALTTTPNPTSTP